MNVWTRRVDNANTRTHPPSPVHPLICLFWYCYCWGWIGLNWRSNKNQPYTTEWWLRIVILVACRDYFPVSSVQATIPVQWQWWKIVKIIWLIIIIMCPHQDLHYNKLTDDYSNTTPASNHPTTATAVACQTAALPYETNYVRWNKLVLCSRWHGLAGLCLPAGWHGRQPNKHRIIILLLWLAGEEKSVGLQNITNATVWRYLTDRISYTVCPISRTYIAYPGNSYVAPILIHHILWKEQKNNNNPGLNWKCRNHNISEWRIWYRVLFFQPPMQEYGVTLKDILFVTHSPSPSSSCLLRKAVRGVRIRDIKYLLSSAWQGIINHIQLERQIPSFGCRLLAYVRCQSHPVILVNHVLTPALPLTANQCVCLGFANDSTFF